jgi:hypothetical protein
MYYVHRLWLLLFLKKIIFFCFCFCGTGAWTQGLHLEPLHQSFFLWWVVLR